MAMANTQSLYRNEDRSNYRRFVEIKASGEEKDFIDGLTIDFSESGMGILTYMPFPIGTELEVSLKDDLFIKGEVVNIEPWPSYDLVRLGIRFVEEKENCLVSF